MIFSETRFPDDISYGSVGGPKFSTDIIAGQNGYEQRKINWSTARIVYNIAYGIKSDEQLSNLIEFFYAKRGKAIAFRFKDWSDYKALKQNIGRGDGKKTTFQMIKNYINGSDSYVRTIYKPVENTVKIYINNEIQSSNYKVDYSNGQIEFFIPPKIQDLIIADFEFDVLVRFDTDELLYSIDDYKNNSCHDIRLIEVKQRI